MLNECGPFAMPTDPLLTYLVMVLEPPAIQAIKLLDGLDGLVGHTFGVVCARGGLVVWRVSLASRILTMAYSVDGFAVLCSLFCLVWLRALTTFGVFAA